MIIRKLISMSVEVNRYSEPVDESDSNSLRSGRLRLPPNSRRFPDFVTIEQRSRREEGAKHSSGSE